MRSRLLQSSVAAALLLSLTICVAVAWEWWTLAAGAGALLVSATLLVSADANRQARLVRRQLRKQARRPDPVRTPAPPALPTTDVDVPVQETRADMLGAVRVLQAQYTARLDRLQAAVDDAVAELRRENDRGAGERTPR